MSFKVAIADDSAAIRSALRMFIESRTDWQVCGEVDNGQAAVFLVQRHKPDLLVLDLSMPVMNGLEAARRITVISPKTRIVLFTAHPYDQVLRDAKAAGIREVLSKDGRDTLPRLLTVLNDAIDSSEAA